MILRDSEQVTLMLDSLYSLKVIHAFVNNGVKKEAFKHFNLIYEYGHSSDESHEVFLQGVIGLLKERFIIENTEYFYAGNPSDLDFKNLIQSAHKKYSLNLLDIQRIIGSFLRGYCLWSEVKESNCDELKKLIDFKIDGLRIVNINQIIIFYLDEHYVYDDTLSSTAHTFCEEWMEVFQ
ncbi:hypothetical protein BK784_28560 [Bacillus thuringiensis serovar medellin]|uniref:Uncharacterized protein n=1 Tax=Bacillus thuringiensis subsp. medellin TaxID=79672 RepID=A0A9X6MVS9_BACTV|nr:hypothetical protein [Bacillus thuringiensis]OUB88470.1 hypothetical protein BK784_28560 [Bacillus thuringiensis serovar medellin]